MTRHLTKEELKETLRILRDAASSDKAQADRYAFAIKSELPMVAERLVELYREKRVARPFPDVSNIHAAQCSIWDNWAPFGGRAPKRSKGEKGARSVRFKASIEIWTIAGSGKALTSANAAFVGTSHLLDGPDLISKIENLRKPTKTQRPFKAACESDVEGLALEKYGDYLIETVAQQIIENGCYAGPIFSISQGTYFHVDTLAVANGKNELVSRDPDLQLAIQAPSGVLLFTDYKSAYRSGKSFPPKLVLQTHVFKATPA